MPKLNGVINVANGMDEIWKSDVLSAVARNANATPEQLQAVIKLANGIENEVWKSDVLIVVARHANALDQVSRQTLIQELLFTAYNKSVGKQDPLGSIKEDLQCLGIESQDLEKAYKAMCYVSGGKKLTEENKGTLKNNSAWIDLIEKICHYLKKVFTLGLGTTQKESRDNFNAAVNSHVEKIKSERNEPKLNKHKNI